MSKQSRAQAAQHYDPKPEPATCGFCKHFTSEKLLPEWMEQANAAARGPIRQPYTVEEHGIEKSLRCGVGEFAVKKLATCGLFNRKPK